VLHSIVFRRRKGSVMISMIIVFLPFLAGLLAYPAGRKNETFRDSFVVLFSFLELFLCLLLLNEGIRESASCSIGGVMACGLSFQADGFRTAYAIVTALMWAGTSLFSGEYFRQEREGLNHYWTFILLTLGATEGVMLSADLMTSFLFFEILSFTSFTWVIHEETKEAVKAAYTYLFVAVTGGLILFMGLLLLQQGAGTLRFDALHDAAVKVLKDSGSSAGESALALGGLDSGRGQIFWGAVCILFGFGAKAGMFPLHIWLPKAHPVAPSPASALLSGVLTKVGIYGILMTSWSVIAGQEAYRSFGILVLVLGTITMVLGAVLALFSVNLKRTLACSSMSQIGFILIGIGMTVLLSCGREEEGIVTARAGTVLHMVNHSLIKLTLFCAAGVVVMNIHKLNLNDIRGWGRNKHLLKISFALGALGISGVPLFNGYISKTLLHESILHGAELMSFAGLLEWAFLISGGCTFAYMLKIFICLFVEKNRDPELQKSYDRTCASGRPCMNRASAAAIFGASLFMPVLGLPPVSVRLAAFMTGSEEILSFQAFTAENLKGSAISLGIGALVYLFLVRKVLVRDGVYVDLWPARLDLEELLYKPFLFKVCLLPLSIAARILADSLDLLILLVRRTVLREKKRKEQKRNAVFDMWQATQLAANPIIRTFSFAMMMTCLGILVILGVLILVLSV